jgi:uncharacterized protein (DUF362 family)
VNTHIEVLDAFVQQASAEGGWGYTVGQPAQLEPTCLGLLALSLEPERYSAAIDKARQTVLACGRADGSYRLAHGREEAAWPTALVLFARLALGDNVDLLKPTAGFLLRMRGEQPKNPKPDEIQTIDPKHDIDLKLTGWPWAEKNFSWVEPTAWACLALRRIGVGEHPRVQEGLALILDRAMDEGGVNYGNRRILGKILDPIPGPTALMLLALQGRPHPRLEAAARYLLRQLDDLDLEHLCWGKLALDLYRHLDGVDAALADLDRRITRGLEHRHQTSWLPATNVRLALAALALGANRRNVFRLPEPLPKIEVIEPPAVSSKPSLTQRLGAWFRGLALRAASNMKAFPAHSGVHIARASSYDEDLPAILQKQYDHFRALSPLKDKRVVLKPNLVEYHRAKVINTDPRFVSAVIELCKREGAREIIVAEGPGHWRNVEYLVAESGLGEVLDKHGVRFVDINHDEPMKIPNLGQMTGLESLYMSKTVATAEVLISLPKLKTHHWAGATLSLKNLFGTLPGICYGWPKNELHWRGIDFSIIDIALSRTPELAIVDGIIGMEGDGPLNGTPKHMGAMVMGNDLVAVDATCCRLMRLDPEKLAYLQIGHAKKLGRLLEAEIPQLGEKIADLAQPFAQVEHLRNVCA